MIERFDAKMLAVNNVLMVSKEAATKPCGCKMYIGIRVDTNDVASAAFPCRVDHESLMQEVQDIMRASLPSDSDEPLVDVYSRIMEEVFPFEAGYS